MILSKKELSQLVPILAATYILASASKAKRRACAAVIVKWRAGIPTIVSSGVNGTPVGADNACETPDLLVSMPSVIHAEIHAVRGSMMPLFNSSVLVCTDSPCENCLRYLKEHTKIDTIVYSRSYRETAHLDGMNFYHVPMEQVRAYIADGVERIDRVIDNPPPEA